MNMRRRLQNDAGDASLLLCRWLSATGSRIVCKGLESCPERGVHAILRQRYTGQPAGLEHRAAVEQPVEVFFPALLQESRIQCTGEFPGPAHEATLQVIITDVSDNLPMRFRQLNASLLRKLLRLAF